MTIVRPSHVVAAAMFLVSAGGGMGQTLPAPIPVPAPAAPSVGPAAPLSAEAREVLKMLQDRKETLKDFTGAIDYNVEDGRTGDSTGKRGTVDFLMDPVRGPVFSADFTMNTEDGKPKIKYHVQFIFDGREFTVKDFGADGTVKKFGRQALLQPGEKPGAAATLGGALPLPIGLDVDEVARTFEVTSAPAKDPNQAILKLVPREKGRFDFTQLTVTVDRKQQLPVKLEEKAKNDDITTITLTGIDINAGKAKLLDPATPAAEGWKPIAE